MSTWTGNLKTKHGFSDADIKAWWKLRAQVRKRAVRCGICRNLFTGELPVVDHIRPHRGDVALFLDPANLQPLHKRCHDGAKARIERAMDKPTVGLDGWAAES